MSVTKIAGLVMIMLGIGLFSAYSQVFAQCSGVCVVSSSCYRVGRITASGSCSDPSQVCCNRFTSLCTAAENCPSASPEKEQCYACMCEQGGTWTDLGCWNTRSINGIVMTVVRLIFGVIGGVSLVLLISVGYLYNTGKPENIEKAKQRIISLFSSIVFLVFSVLLLRVIGVNILDVTTPGIIN